jgi:predicted hotdog family 3-hydroxylacyl-ACP dehydratase
MRTCAHPIADLLPHAPPMVLLDAVRGWDKDRLEAEVTIRRDGLFFRPGLGVPAHVGIEYMAQACGAFAGLEARKTGDDVRIGFLLGTRRYRATVDWFAEGMRLTVRIVEIFRDGSMGVFDCAILGNGREQATAQINLYQPDRGAPENATVGERA